MTLEDRLLGARIVGVVPQAGGLLKIEFEHRGTDDDSGFFIVSLGRLYFDAGFEEVKTR